MIKLVFITSFLLLSFRLSAQDAKPDFGSPLEIPLILSGNFAEMRNNHFHTGLDIKTGGAEGKRVLAAENGQVVRIAISPYGYGKAIYIAHPNGYTTVYAHLQSLSEKIEAVVKAEQYAKKSFAVDFTPPQPLEVSRGEVIALSGNTGGSGGPHLHFEIRETETEHPINPLLFNFDIVDKLEPVLRGLRFHPLSDTTLINGKNEAMGVVLTGSNGKYSIKNGDKITVYGSFGISLHAVDFLNGGPNKCGVYELILTVDGQKICQQDFSELDFATNRQINCYKDFESFRKHGWHYHKSFLEPGNTLAIYHPRPPNDGILNFPNKGNHTGSYVVHDAYGNESKLNFTFESVELVDRKPRPPAAFDAYFHWDRPGEFEYNDGFRLHIPDRALYEDLRFNFGVQMKSVETMSSIYLVHNEMTPLDKPIELDIEVKSIPADLRPKLVAARYPIAGGGATMISGIVEGDLFRLKSKDFGKFTLLLDTVAPTLQAEKPSGKLSSSSAVGFKIGDSRSGVGRYDGYLNGEWILLEYEPKQRRIWFIANEVPMKKGENSLEIVLSDACGNETRKTFKYTY